MENFDILVPFSKSVSDEGTLKLFGGIASTTSIDRDNERMDKSVLNKIASGLQGAPVFFNHDTKGLGIGKVSKAADVGDEVRIEVIPTTAKSMSDQLTQIKEGILKSFSIGGRVLKIEKEYDEKLNKDVGVIKDVEIYEVSVVGIPANKDASILSYMSKSFKGVNLEDKKEMSEEDKKKKDDKKEDESEKECEGKKKSFEDSISTLQKNFVDLRDEYKTKFLKIEKQVAELENEKEELTNANKALKSRIDDLNKILDERAKSLQAEPSIPVVSEKREKVEKNIDEEPARFL